MQVGPKMWPHWTQCSLRLSLATLSIEFTTSHNHFVLDKFATCGVVVQRAGACVESETWSYHDPDLFEAWDNWSWTFWSELVSDWTMNYWAKNTWKHMVWRENVKEMICGDFPRDFTLTVGSRYVKFVILNEKNVELVKKVWFSWAEVIFTTVHSIVKYISVRSPP